MYPINKRGEDSELEPKKISSPTTALVFPDNRKSEVQNVEWMILKQNFRDLVCLVDLSVIHMSNQGKSLGGLGFSSLTAR